MEFFDAIANMSALSFAQHMVNGISLGSLYALIAIGYTMVYGILLMINFAHGDIVMMACYFAFFGITAFHIPWYFTFIITIIMTALLGVLIERSAYRPLREAPKNSILISAIGASFLLENLANYLFSGRPMRFPDVLLLSQNISVGGCMPPSASPLRRSTPARKATSPSPVQSMTVLARIASRPALLSTTTPFTASPSRIASAKKV